MSNCIYGLSKLHGNEVISVTKEKLQKIEHITIISKEDVDRKFNTNHTFESLERLNTIRYLNIFDNLEYLSISNGVIIQQMFNGLNKLIKLKLENCKYYYALNSEIFSHLKGLKYLEMSNFSYFQKNYYDKDNEFNLNWLKPLENL